MTIKGRGTRRRQYAFDVAVIGGGSGGYAAARTTAAAGLRTVVVDGAAELGGLCILKGCMPTKALLHSAEVAHMVRRAGEFGVRTGRSTVNFRRVMERKAELIGEFARYRQGQLTDGRFELIRSKAEFLDAHTLRLGDGTTLTAGQMVIATGSRVAPVGLDGLAEAGYLTSDDALELRAAPKSLVVLGGGAVALELAQFFARCGSKVTVIQRSPQVLRDSDEDAAEALTGALRAEGLDVFVGTRLLSARRVGRLKEVTFEHQGGRVSVRAAEILHGLGRVPNTSGLGLDRAGVVVENGRIVTDARMRTSAGNIFAVGDCASPHEVVHLAVSQGEVAGHNIVRPRQPREMDYRLLIGVVFTEPQVAVVGLTEKEALRRGVKYLAESYPFDDHGKSQILGATHGFVKLLASPKTGELLGGCCVGPQGGELIHEIVAAMAKRMTAAELAAMPHYHPTLAEIWTYPAEALAEKIG